MLANTLQFHIQRRNDKCIMDDLTRGSSSNTQLIQLNACRLYLNIIHLSDIVNPDENRMQTNLPVTEIKMAPPTIPLRKREETVEYYN